MIAENLTALAVNIDTIKLDPRNARKHPQPNLDALKKSLTTYGQRKPVVVNKKTMTIEAGNGLWQAAKELGWTEIAAVFVEDSKETAQAYSLMDNQSALLADWDLPALKDLLEELDTGAFDMGLTGFDDKAIEDLMNQFHTPTEGLTDDDEIPEKVETICKTGDLWQLGNHRLLCGDSTKKEDVERLMGGEKADMVFTDPPYGINIVRGISTIGGAKHFGRVRQRGGKPAGVVGGKGIVEPRLYHPGLQSIAVCKHWVKTCLQIIGDDKPFEPAL